MCVCVLLRQNCQIAFHFYTLWGGRSSASPKTTFKDLILRADPYAAIAKPNDGLK